MRFKVDDFCEYQNKQFTTLFLVTSVDHHQVWYIDLLEIPSSSTFAKNSLMYRDSVIVASNITTLEEAMALYPEYFV